MNASGLLKMGIVLLMLFCEKFVGTLNDTQKKHQNLLLDILFILF